MIGIGMHRGLGVLAVVAVLAAPPGAAGQDQQQGQAPPGDTTELVFEREVFTYPTYERRNPFEALSSETTGPRFENLVLIGIIHSPDPDLSVALLAEGVQYDESGVLELEEGRGGVQLGGREGAQAGQDTASAQEGQVQEDTEAQGIETVGYETFRVRQGDQLGNMRILEIQRMRVIVEVEEFGITERREFVLRTPANRGGQP